MMRLHTVIGLIILSLVCACTFTQKVRTGMQAYQVRQYYVAADLFAKEYESASDKNEKARLAFLAGESNRYLQNYGEAAHWFQQAYQDGYGEKALEGYAHALKHQERYSEAMKAYEDLLTLNPGNPSYRSYITLNRQAMEWSANPNKYVAIQKAPFNSSAADYGALPLDKNYVLFTSDRASKQNQDTYLWTGRAYSDLFISSKGASQVAEFDGTINTPDNEGNAVLSPDGNTLIFTRCYVRDAYDAWCKLMISHRRNQEWSQPEPLPFVKEKVNYGHPAFAANGTVLFFASDAPGGSGGHDIFFTQSDSKGGWSEPVNLGSLINTSGEELYPTVFNDTLYYSSDYLPGLGGLDIFKTYLGPNDQWVAPINLRAPVNSGADDFGFVVDTFSTPGPDEIMSGYFTSSRNGPGSGDDIYSFSISKPEVDVIATADTISTKEEPSINYQVFLALRVLEPEYEIKEDPNSRVINRRPLPNGPVIVTQGVVDERFVTDELGQLLLKLEWNEDYMITARYRDHLASTYSFNTREIARNPSNPITTINHTMVLDPIFKNKEIILENIFYDYDEWVIREDAKPSLDELSAIMKANPTIRIQLSSHTDCRGTSEYNQELSQKRAQSAVEYLVSVGIPARRLEAQGFGESNPSVRCECDYCTEEEHQKNRRTTFKIID
jgi:outer membrane protein OmpA-like peptidoglycan-associated protein